MFYRCCHNKLYIAYVNMFLIVYYLR